MLDKHNVIILSGSSQNMMHGLFLNRKEPLYGRALKIIKLEPMSYRSFCLACEMDPLLKDSFIKYSLVGGIPRYWEFIEKDDSPVSSAEE